MRGYLFLHPHIDPISLHHRRGKMLTLLTSNQRTIGFEAVIKRRPPKIENVLEFIRQCIEEDRYTLTTHALIRQKERDIHV